jgi:hypothetical protein
MGTADGVCYIFTVEDPGITQDRSIPGFWAIGSGAFHAISSLYQRGLRPAAYLAKALYGIYEAKKYAENVGSVGEKTDIWIMRPDEAQRGWIKNEKIERELEAVWQVVKPRDVDVHALQQLIASMRADQPKQTADTKPQSNRKLEQVKRKSGIRK